MSLPETTLATQPRALNAVSHWMRGSDLPRLTVQQMALVKALASGRHTQTSAYEEAYPTCKAWPRKDVWAAASRAANHPKVKAWLDFAWTAEAKHVNRTALGHVYRLEQVFEKALDNGAYGAAVQAEKAHAEALGHRSQDGEAAVSVTIKTFAQSDQQVSSPTIEHEPD